MLFLVCQCLDRCSLPGICAPLNLVESLPCLDAGLSFQVAEFEQPRGCRDVDVRSFAKIRGAKSFTRGDKEKPLVKAKPGSETRRAHWSQGANVPQRTGWQENGASRQLALAV